MLEERIALIDEFEADNEEPISDEQNDKNFFVVKNIITLGLITLPIFSLLLLYLLWTNYYYSDSSKSAILLFLFLLPSMSLGTDHFTNRLYQYRRKLKEGKVKNIRTNKMLKQILKRRKASQMAWERFWNIFDLILVVMLCWEFLFRNGFPFWEWTAPLFFVYLGATILFLLKNYFDLKQALSTL